MPVLSEHVHCRMSGTRFQSTTANNNCRHNCFFDCSTWLKYLDGTGECIMGSWPNQTTSFGACLALPLSPPAAYCPPLLSITLLPPHAYLQASQLDSSWGACRLTTHLSSHVCMAADASQGGQVTVTLGICEACMGDRRVRMGFAREPCKEEGPCSPFGCRGCARTQSVPCPAASVASAFPLPFPCLFSPHPLL